MMMALILIGSNQTIVEIAKMPAETKGPLSSMVATRKGTQVAINNMEKEN